MVAPPVRRPTRGWNALAAAALVNAGLVLVLDHVQLPVHAPAASASAPPADERPWPGPLRFAEVALVGASPPALSLDAILGTGDAMADGTGARLPRSTDLPGDRAADRGGGAEGGTASWTERRDRADDTSLRSRIWNAVDAYRAAREAGRRPAASTEAITRHAAHTYGDRAPRRRAAAGAEVASTGDATGTGRAAATVATPAAAPDAVSGTPGTTIPARVDGAPQPTHEAAFVDQGERSVDVRRKGATADDRAVAAASNQRNVDPFDLTAPRAGGDHAGEGVRGREAPGQLADGRGAGTAASRAGQGRGGVPTYASRQDAYFIELFRRLDRAIIYPRELALGMISGRVVALVTLRADGELTGVDVHASSGHRQFDDQLVGALRGVRRLPPVPVALLEGKPAITIMIPYTFRSPMIR